MLLFRYATPHDSGSGENWNGNQLEIIRRVKAIDSTQTNMVSDAVYRHGSKSSGCLMLLW
jgi:hypothetical protein